MENKAFNKGDFIKYVAYNGNNQNVTFGIFEGVDLAPDYQYAKKFSLLLYYDGHKYCNEINGGGWGYRPVLDVGAKNKPCDKTIDTMCEDSWWKLCTEEEKENALKVLEDYGYKWDEESMSLIDLESNEVVHKIIVPKIEYNGDSIKPIGDNFKDILKKAVIKKNSNTYQGTYPNYTREYCYDDMYD